MSNPLHASYYADQAVHHTVEVIENVRLARDTYRVRFACPELARRVLPGQFLMLRLAGWNDPLLGRPLAMYNTTVNSAGQPEAVDVVYFTGGKMTRRLAEFRAGQRLDVWGPLGNGFSAEPIEHLIMVAGGIGQTPFLALSQERLGVKQFGEPKRSVPRAKRITFCYGARSADLLAGVEDFHELSRQHPEIETLIATDDGSAGHHGLVTELLNRTLDETKLAPMIISCGPERMMEAVAEIAHQRHVACRVSLETPMACGIGICFTCVAKIRDEQGEWDYKRTCVEGPVFDAAKVIW